MMCDLPHWPNQAAQRPSVGWAYDHCGSHFMVQLRTTPSPQADVTKAPIRWGGRALRGGPLGLDSARGCSGVGRA